MNKTKATHSYLYDLFYLIHGDQCQATVRGKNLLEAKKRFKAIYGGWKIVHHQRLKNYK